MMNDINWIWKISFAAIDVGCGEEEFRNNFNEKVNLSVDKFIDHYILIAPRGRYSYFLENSRVSISGESNSYWCLFVVVAISFFVLRILYIGYNKYKGVS